MAPLLNFHNPALSRSSYSRDASYSRGIAQTLGCHSMPMDGIKQVYRGKIAL
jgi:hypothetical protein